MSRLPHLQETHQKKGNRPYKQRVDFAKEAMREREMRERKRERGHVI